MPSELPPPAPPPPGSEPLWQPGVPGIDQSHHDDDPRGGPRRMSLLTMLSAVVSAVIGLFVLGMQAGATSLATNGRSTGFNTGDLIILFLVVINPAFITLRWWVTTYTVTEREIVLDTGLFTRTKKVVPFARLQQIDLHQKLFDQIVNTATLQIDTAGESGHAKVRLGLLSAPHARSLREYALRRRAELHPATTTPVAPVAPDPPVVAASGPFVASAGGITAPAVVSAVPGAPTWGAPPVDAPRPPPPPPWSTTDPPTMQAPWQQPERRILQLDPGRLLTAAFTHHLVVDALPAVVLVWVWAAAINAAAQRDGASAAAFGGIGGGLIVFVGFVVVMVAVSTVLNQYGFTVSEVGDDLHLRYGLLEVRNVTVPRRRIQHLTVTDNPLRRAFGLVAVTLHTAAPADVGNVQTRFQIPILSRRELEIIVRDLLGRPDWTVPELTPRPDAAQRRAITRRVGILALLVAIPAYLLQPFGPVLFAIALLGMPWGMVAHRRAGHGETSRNVALSRGVFHHRIDVVPVDRVQSCHAERNPMQRMAGLSTLHIDIAGSGHAVWLYDMAATACSETVQELPRRSVPRPA